MKGDAGRSIIQTNIQRWHASGSVVTCDPTGFLDIQGGSDGALLVAPTRSYPIGLGFGPNGFALHEDERVCIPATSFAVWYLRKQALPIRTGGEVEAAKLVESMRAELDISSAEYEAIFVDDDLPITTTGAPLTNAEVYRVCSSFLQNPGRPIAKIEHQTF